MSQPFVIFGSEMSPYSTKVRSYMRYKQLDHVWTQRGLANDADYQRYARLPIVPTVVTPQGEGRQDSTPIIEAIEAEHPEPSIQPQDQVLAFLCVLIEEFGDEWGNKLMFHHRWHARVDRLAASHTLARLSLPDAGSAEVEARAALIAERMTGRTHFVGSSPENAPQITGYYIELIDLLQAHLAGRSFLFGARPSFGDFGLAAQLYQASVDPTCGALMRARARAVLDWCYRMHSPREEGPFETWDQIAPTLQPLIAHIGATFLPWSLANAQALAKGETSFAVELPGGTYGQAPQKYHAKSLAALGEKFRLARGHEPLVAVLQAAGCLEHLDRAAARS